jgi:PAS domain S-box-containing protein
MNSERFPGVDDRLAPAETHDDRITVLHVDDQPELADLAATFLEREDDRIDVVSEHSASDGLARLEDGDVDCIVSDYDMPGTDGIEFLETVRESDPDLPFILYTGKGSEEVASDAVSAGVTDYLQKGAGTEQYTLLANRIENAVEQSRSRRALERHRERFRTLVEESSDVILIVDAFAEISYATPSAERVLGRTPEQLVGTSGLDPIHPEDVGRVGELFAELVENPGERQTVEFRYRRPDGGYIWAEARGRNLLGDPVIDGIVIYTRELTERVERERELEETNGLLSSLFEALPVGVLAADADRKVMAINERLCELLDVAASPDNVLGDDCAAFAEDVSDRFGDPEGFVDRVEAVVSAEESVDGETIALADGRTVERSHRRIDLPDGRGHLWTYRDVTEREVNHRTLTRQEAFLRNSPDLFFVIDAHGEVTYQSHASEGILGYEIPDLRGEQPIEYVHPEDKAAVQADFERLLSEAGETITSEYRFRLPSGEYRWYENRAINRLDDPEVEGVLVVNRDVTERKHRERELQRRNDRLAEFTSIVSHDLRNPLQVAAGRVELVADHDLPEPAAENLAAIDEAIDRMERLIDNLLTLAQEGDTISGTEAVALAELVDDCWSNVATEGAWLVVDTDATVRADRTRLRQLFENLFRNAVEHAGPEVTVTVGDLADGTGFYVADDGPGIPERERGHVFEFGYSTSESGTGFGLRIVEQVAEAHGWDLRVTESESGGARFEFSGVESVDSDLSER